MLYVLMISTMSASRKLYILNGLDVSFVLRLISTLKKWQAPCLCHTFQRSCFNSRYYSAKCKLQFCAQKVDFADKCHHVLLSRDDCTKRLCRSFFHLQRVCIKWQACLHCSIGSDAHGQATMELEKYHKQWGFPIFWMHYHQCQLNLFWVWCAKR